MGVTLRIEDGYIVAAPKAKLTPELWTELQRHKPELLELLVWDEEAAYRILKDAWAYISEFHESVGSPDFGAEPIREAKDKVDEAYEQRNAHTFRCAVRQWVEEAIKVFEAAKDRGAA